MSFNKFHVTLKKKKIEGGAGGKVKVITSYIGNWLLLWTGSVPDFYLFAEPRVLHKFQSQHQAKILKAKKWKDARKTNRNEKLDVWHTGQAMNDRFLNEAGLLCLRHFEQGGKRKTHFSDFSSSRRFPPFYRSPAESHVVDLKCVRFIDWNVGRNSEDSK